MATSLRLRLTAPVLVASLAAGLAEAPSGVASETVAGARLVVDCGDDCWPAAFAFTPSGKQIFYLERFTGEIHRYTLGSGADTIWGSVGPVDAGGERGALGIAVDPRWDSGKKKRRWKRRWIYVFFTNDSPLENRVERLRKSRRGNDVKTERLATISITAGANHNAGVIHFGPDGKLYVVTGDQAVPSRSQDLADPAGKVLRLDRNGSRPGDNPLPGGTAFSFGHRNSFGFTFDPATGSLWQTENGPSCDDEVNLVVAGGNYGWGSGSTCPDTTSEGPSPRPPEHEWTPPIVPTGAAFCQGCGVGDAVEGDLLVGVYGSGEILNLGLDAQRDDVTGEAVLYDHPSGVLAVERRPNGQVYFSDDGGIYLLTA
ncbi:MAG: PQQ-dependent sugar dehydrogenase [Actinomycetota bacterium]